jgi:hypothetical protein
MNMIPAIAKKARISQRGTLSTTAIALAINVTLSSSVLAAVTCEPQGSEVLVSELPSLAVRTALDLTHAKAKPGDEGSYRLAQRDGKALLATTDGRSFCSITLKVSGTEPNAIDDNRVATAVKKAMEKIATETKKKKADEDLFANLIAAGTQDLGVPSSPALSLLGVDASKATSPKTPKDLAAAIVQGRGADGKIKAGVAVDISVAQIFEAFKAKEEPKKGVAPIKPEAPKVSPFKQLSKISQSAYSAKLQNQPTYSISPRTLMAPLAVKADVETVDGDSTPPLFNRLKLSLATTQDSEADKADKTATDIAFGAHYVFFDQSDSISSDCDGENQRNETVQAGLKALIKEKGGKLLGDSVTSSQLRALRNGKYPDVKLEDEELTPVLAACALTAMEQLKASAAMIGIASSYKLTDGAWSNRQSGVRGIAATYVSPGFEMGGDTVLQAIGHFRATRHQIVADPDDAAKKVFQDSNLASLRFRAAGVRGAGSLEFSRSKNTTGGKSETVTRRALGLEWRLAPNIWLVGSGGTEKSTLGTSKSTPFVITNLRFGGSGGTVPTVPPAVVN